MSNLSEFPGQGTIRGTTYKTGEKLKEQHKLVNKAHMCLEFDGKQNLVSMPHCQKKKQENISVISQPSGMFVDFFSPKNGSGVALANGLYNVCEETESLETLRMLKMDGCKFYSKLIIQNTVPKLLGFAYFSDRKHIIFM